MKSVYLAAMFLFFGCNTEKDARLYPILTPNGSVYHNYVPSSNEIVKISVPYYRRVFRGSTPKNCTNVGSYEDVQFKYINTFSSQPVVISFNGDMSEYCIKVGNKFQTVSYIQEKDYINFALSSSSKIEYINISNDGLPGLLFTYEFVTAKEYNYYIWEE